MLNKPVILISSAADAQSTGWNAHNGGCKLYSLWVKLLRQHGYEAYVVTTDGTGEDWLIEMPPFLSLADAAALKASGREIRWMTGWLWAKAFLDLVGDDDLFFFDAELAFTAEAQRGLLERWMPRMACIATHSRTQQAYYMTRYGITPMYIPEWSDTAYWTPNDRRRVTGRIGYLDEGDHTETTVRYVQQRCAEAGLTPEFVCIRGDERQVLDAMQTCDLYLGLNRGKHPLFGEGCPRGQQEAQHAGAVVAAYDVHGNREYLFDGWNGYLVANGDTDAMARRVVELLSNHWLRGEMRQRSIDFATHDFAPEVRWPLVAEFLELEP